MKDEGVKMRDEGVELTDEGPASDPSSLILHPSSFLPAALTLPVVIAIVSMHLSAGCNGRTPRGSPSPHKIRVAIIGGMIDTGFWPDLAERFEKATGGRYKIEVVAAGPKNVIAAAFRRGQADLITMHASDTIINLAADGYARDPQPWLKNDMVIVGPHDDPAGIRNLKSAAEAFTKIAAKKAPFVVHSSLGAQEVMREILDAGEITMPSEQLTLLFTDRARDVLKIAAEKRAYTLVGRIPFLNGKLPNQGLELMVRGDPQLRRPYIVAVADPSRVAGANVAGARELAEFLRRPETQAWIAGYGAGKLDDQPIFFPIEL
jgi:tungstate transport system substrate-binding protein